MKQTIVYIGIDVAKAHLDVAWQKRLRRFDNDKAGRATLVKWIKQKQSDPVQVICEASGGYEQELLDALAEAALAVSLVQATRVRQYARAAGILAKTDKVDARVLARFGAAMRPEPTSPRSAAQKLLRKLESQRRHLSYLLVAEQNRLEQLNDEKLRRLTCALMGTLKKQIALIDSRHRHFNHAGPRTLPKSPKAHQRQRRRRAHRCTAASADARAGHAQSTGSCRSGGLGTF